MLAAFRAGFPDLHITVQDSFGAGDRAVVRWQMTGTHTADLFGMPPTGKAVTVNGISIVREAGGLIVEDWVSEDTAGMMRQLGMA
jgi:predicted ester cyclase